MAAPANGSADGGDAPPTAVLLDLLMAVMNSVETWTVAVGDERRGLAWRDAVTARMIGSGRYVPYERLVAGEARGVGLPPGAVERLTEGWRQMRPWPDVAALRRLRLPYAFVTNCSTRLANEAASRSVLTPRFVLSAEMAGWFKPRSEVYLRACELMESSPERTLFVAGAAYDAIGADRAGLRARLVLRRPPPADLPASVLTCADLGSALTGSP